MVKIKNFATYRASERYMVQIYHIFERFLSQNCHLPYNSANCYHAYIYFKRQYVFLINPVHFSFEVFLFRGHFIIKISDLKSLTVTKCTVEIPNLCRDRTVLNSIFDRTEPESNPNPNRTQFSSGSVE